MSCFPVVRGNRARPPRVAGAHRLPRLAGFTAWYRLPSCSITYACVLQLASNLQFNFAPSQTSEFDIYRDAISAGTDYNTHALISWCKSFKESLGSYYGVSRVGLRKSTVWMKWKAQSGFNEIPRGFSQGFLCAWLFWLFAIFASLLTRRILTGGSVFIGCLLFIVVTVNDITFVFIYETSTNVHLEGNLKILKGLKIKLRQHHICSVQTKEHVRKHIYLYTYVKFI